MSEKDLVSEEPNTHEEAESHSKDILHAYFQPESIKNSIRGNYDRPELASLKSGVKDNVTKALQKLIDDLKDI